MKAAGTYYSNGKLMLMGEYLVLHGATALVMPVRYGQKLTVSAPEQKGTIHWQAYDRGVLWVEIFLEGNTLKVLETSDTKTAAKISQILKAAATLCNDTSLFSPGVNLRWDTNFNRLWGLGTSSTLISNLSNWLDIDPYALHARISKGSGFDIACASSTSPLLFRQKNGSPETIPVTLPEAVTRTLYFIYLGKKEDSEAAVSRFLTKHWFEEQSIEIISKISKQLAVTEDMAVWKRQMRRHEAILSGILQHPTLKESLFPDFPGEIKWLGAWGGDFAMVLWEGEKNILIRYFEKKGYSEVHSFEEMRYSNPDAATQ